MSAMKVNNVLKKPQETKQHISALCALSILHFFLKKYAFLSKQKQL